jgi:hypothetical protein
MLAPAGLTPPVDEIPKHTNLKNSGPIGAVRQDKPKFSAGESVYCRISRNLLD